VWGLCGDVGVPRAVGFAPLLSTFAAELEGAEGGREDMGEHTVQTLGGAYSPGAPSRTRSPPAVQTAVLRRRHGQFSF